MKRFCRILFSRYMICIVFILLELLLLLPSTTFHNETTLRIMFYFYIVIAVISIISLINKDLNPEYKVSWLMAIIFIPYVGTLFYVIFSRRRISRREMRIFSEIVPIISARRRGTDQGTVINKLAEQDSLAAAKVRAIINDDYLAELSQGTVSKYYPAAECMYEDMKRSLMEAEKFIFLEYFIMQDGEMLRGILEILKERAAAGVEVRIMYDDVGCMGRLGAEMPDLEKQFGIKCVRFGRITPWATAVHNNRNHRKQMIIDGVCAYTGGVNIADEYINLTSPFGHWKDGGIRIIGRAVASMTELFLVSWDLSSGEISNYGAYTETTPSNESDGGFYVPFGSGPSPIYRRPVGKNVFLNIINQAEEYVFITTPYLIIDFDLTEALRNAALRGVDVKIITPGTADKKLVNIMTKSSYRYLIDAGVKIFEYTPGFIHEKVLVSDGVYAVVGTINFDYRSLAHHYENAVWMAYTPSVQSIYEEYLKTLDACEKIDAKRAKLNPIEWIFKIGIKIFAPLL